MSELLDWIKKHARPNTTICRECGEWKVLFLVDFEGMCIDCTTPANRERGEVDNVKGSDLRPGIGKDSTGE